MRLSALNKLAPLALVAIACASSPVGTPAEFKQAPIVTRIYAVDPPANSPFFSNNTGVSFGEVLIYSTDPTDNVTATPPPSFTRFRVEFNQPIDASKLLKSAQADTLPNSRSSLNGGFNFSYCAPADPNNPGIQVVDLDPATKHPVVSSICYDPGSQVGQAPHVTVVPGSGISAANDNPAPFTCQAFTADNGNAYVSKHQYGIQFIPADISGSTGSGQLALPASWSNNTFSFKTAGFDIMAVGTQNSVTGYFDWQDKPYAGFMHQLTATNPADEVDCDPTALVSRTGCRVFSDGSPFLIVTTQPVATDNAGNVAGVTVTRAGSNTAPDYTVGTGFDPRVITIVPGQTWEPGQTYQVKLDPTQVKAAPANGETNVTTLDTPPRQPWSFTAGPGSLGPAAGSTIVYASTPANGKQNYGDIALAKGLNFLFQLPIDPGSVNNGKVTVTRSDGKTIAGTAAIDSASNNQSLTWTPANPTSLLGATYTATVSGYKVGPNVPNAGATFQPYTTQFTVSNFRASGLYSGTSKVDGTRSMPLESLVNGKWSIVFDDAADPSTVTPANLPLTLAGGAAGPALVVTPMSATQYGLKLSDTTTPIKFNTQYVVTASNNIKEAQPSAGGLPESTGQNLHAENCTTSTCPDARGFFTRAFTATLHSNPTTSSGADNYQASKGAVTVTFNYPTDGASIQSQLATGVTLVPGTYDPTLGFQPKGSGNIAAPCTIDATNRVLTCTPASSLATNTPYRVLASFKNVKVISSIVSNGVTVPLDQATGTFSGTLTATFLSACQ